MILKLESFCNEHGMLVQQRTMVSGPAAPFNTFMGTVGVKVEDGGMQTIEFSIDAETIEEAFEKFKESADIKVAKIRAEQMKAAQPKPQPKPKPKPNIMVLQKPKKLILP